jgi:hypothetical protein
LCKVIHIINRATERVEGLSAVIEAMLARTGDDSRVRVGEKLLLTIAEAAVLTGLPRQLLRECYDRIVIEP